MQAVHNCARVGFRQSQLVRKAEEREHRRWLQEEQRRRLEQQLDAIRAEVRHELLIGARYTADGCMCCMVRTEGSPGLTRRCIKQMLDCYQLPCMFAGPAVMHRLWQVTVLLSWLHVSSMVFFLRQVWDSPIPACA